MKKAYIFEAAIFFTMAATAIAILALMVPGA
jgi:hypothetical protein